MKRGCSDLSSLFFCFDTGKKSSKLSGISCFIFISKTKTRKAVHTTIITTYTIGYWGLIQSEVTMNELFIK